MSYVVTYPENGVPFNVLIYNKQGDKKPVGFFKLVMENILEKKMTIYYMWIRPKHRRRGHAKKVIDETKHNMDEITTQISSSTEESISFLKHQGFQEEKGWLTWRKKT